MPLLTRAEFTDMFELRLLLEGAAARMAAERGTAPMHAELAAAAIAVAPRRGADDGWRSHTAFTALDARFHDLIAEAAGNTLLRDGIARLHAHRTSSHRTWPPR